jgi:rubrerythrin
MLGIAKEEDAHRESLGKWYKTRFGDRFQVDPRKPELPEFNYGDIDFMQQAKVLEVISFAIDVEGKLIETYQALSKTAPSEQDAKLVKTMAKDETAHRKMLQKQYAQVKKKESFWNIA